MASKMQRYKSSRRIQTKRQNESCCETKGGRDMGLEGLEIMKERMGSRNAIDCSDYWHTGTHTLRCGRNQPKSKTSVAGKRCWEVLSDGMLRDCSWVASQDDWGKPAKIRNKRMKALQNRVMGIFDYMKTQVRKRKMTLRLSLSACATPPSKRRVVLLLREQQRPVREQRRRSLTAQE